MSFLDLDGRRRVDLFKLDLILQDRVRVRARGYHRRVHRRLVRGRNGCGLVLFDLPRQPVDPFHSLRRPDLARRPIDLDQEEVLGFKAKGESPNSPLGLYLVYLDSG